MGKDLVCGCGCGRPLEASDICADKYLVVRGNSVLVKVVCFEEAVDDEYCGTSGVACSL